MKTTIFIICGFIFYICLPFVSFTKKEIKKEIKVKKNQTSEYIVDAINDKENDSKFCIYRVTKLATDDYTGDSQWFVDSIAKFQIYDTLVFELKRRK